MILLLSSLWLLQFRQSQFLQILNMRRMLLESPFILEEYYCKSFGNDSKLGELGKNTRKIPSMPMVLAKEKLSCKIDVEIHNNSVWRDLCVSRSPKAINIKRYYRLTLSCPLVLSLGQKDKTSLLIFR